MATQTSDNSLANPYNIGPDEYPFYSNESKSSTKNKEAASVWNDADTLSSYRLSRAAAPAPNTVIPTGSDGKLPATIIPSLSGSAFITNRAGTLFYTLYVEDDGALSYSPI